MTFRHGLGDRVKDKVTGLQGIVASRSEHLYGCARYWVQPQELKDGKAVEGQWFDEDSIDVIEPGVIAPMRYRVVDEDETERTHLRRAGGPASQPASVTGPTTR